MLQRLAGTLLLATLVCAMNGRTISQDDRNDPVVHKPSGLRFPAKIEQFERTKVRDEGEFGLIINYELEDPGVFAVVKVKPLGGEKLSDVWDRELAAKAKSPLLEEAKLTANEAYVLKRGERSIAGRRTKFDWKSPLDDVSGRVTEMYVFPIRDHYICVATSFNLADEEASSSARRSLLGTVSLQ